MVIPTSFSTPTLIDCSCLDLDLKNKEKRSGSGSWCWGAFIVSPPSQSSSSLQHILMPVPNVPTIILTVQSGHGESQRCVSPPSDVHFSKNVKPWTVQCRNAPRATRSWAEIPATSPECWPMPPPSPHIDTSCASHHKNTPLCFCPLLKGSLVTKWVVQTPDSDQWLCASKLEKKSHETKQPMKSSIFMYI